MTSEPLNRPGGTTPTRNRVDPWGDLHAVGDRGLLTGNRGCLIGTSGTIARHQRSFAWITCVLAFRDHRQPIADARRWTPIFFLDEAVALAAGHRPCAYCRRSDYLAYVDAVAGVPGSHDVPGPRSLTDRLLAPELNQALAEQRYHRTGSRPADRMRRASARRTWIAAADTLPAGTVFLGNDAAPWLIGPDGHQFSFTFAGWQPTASAARGIVQVLTPPTSVAALRHGYRPLLHPSVHLLATL